MVTSSASGDHKLRVMVGLFTSSESAVVLPSAIIEQQSLPPWKNPACPSRDCQSSVGRLEVGVPLVESRRDPARKEKVDGFVGSDSARWTPSSSLRFSAAMLATSVPTEGMFRMTPNGVGAPSSVTLQKNPLMGFSPREWKCDCSAWRKRAESEGGVVPAATSALMATTLVAVEVGSGSSAPVAVDP